MNKYEECLFYYIMEHEWPGLLEQEAYRLLAERIDCGTSLLHMETGYLHKEENMVLAVISNRDLPRVNQLILEVDPEAFIIVNRINEVRGRGFTLNKVYR